MLVTRVCWVLIFLILIPFLRALDAQAASDGALRPSALRCEYRVDPTGIDETSPRLTWVLLSGEGGQRQTAYRVLVASNTGILQADEGDLWDSGKVDSDDTTAIVYAGQPLRSEQHCFWKVKVWDREQRASAWSDAALWSMGLLQASDWRAQWIGSDQDREVQQPAARFAGAKWIGFADDEPLNGPQGHRLFAACPKLPQDIRVKKAELLAVADDRVWFVFNGQTLLAGKSGWKQVSAIDVTPHVRAGENDFRVQVENGSQGPTGLLAKLIVTTEDGATSSIVSDDSWRCTNQPGANWHNRDLDTGEWSSCRILGDYGMAPWGTAEEIGLCLPPPKYLRTAFQVARPVKRATIYATALGNCDVHLNGNRVNDEYFNPGWTDYTKRVYYRSYDVTDQIQPGANVLGGILADGWYSGYVGFGKIRNHYGTKPRLLVQLNIQYSDGSSQVVATGPEWRVSTGPIREADFLMGETYDARLAIDGWDDTGYDAESWGPVAVGAEMNPVVEANPGPPVLVFEEFKPAKISEPQPGIYVVDMGQNVAGFLRLHTSEKAGQKVQLRFAERLNPDGTIYTANLREARCVDTYVCGGDDDELWEPRFTFHGFQYVEITGLTTEPCHECITGIVLSSANPVVGRFECSDPMLNRLHRNIQWTQWANFIDIPTDCPQRDERLGWTGDAQVYVRTATLNADVQAFFNKWLVDLTDAQRADGQFPMVAPLKVAGADGGPAWADAGVICPWNIYEIYDDRRVLQRQYDSMVKFVEFCISRSTPELLPPEQFHCFGDWLSINADTPKDVIYTAYFAYSTKLLAQAAEVLEKDDDAAKYVEVFHRIKESFNRAYVADDGRIKGNTQCVYVLALAFDLLDVDKRSLAAEHLVADIEARDGHLSTGFIGTKDLMLVLTKIGRTDVAYRLLHNDTFPSWGFSIKHGATSIWERWDGWTPENGFQTPAMNSFAHYSFGAVYQWMVENIGGIHSEGPGYKRILIAPLPDEKLTWANVAYDSIRGPIRSAWKRDGEMMQLEISIPANTTGTVILPTADSASILENGEPLQDARGITLVRTGKHTVVLAVESGAYYFEFAKPSLITAK